MAATGLVAVVLALLVPAAAPASNRFEPPPQGMYENCDPATHEAECLERLSELRDAGIEVVLNYWVWQGTPEQQLAYADRAHALGMKVIWPTWLPGTGVAHLLADLSKACECAGPDLLERAVRLVRDHPATWGYYVGEELWELDPAMSAASELVESLDGDHPRLYVGWGGFQAGRNLRPFAKDADVVAADYYPVSGMPIQNTRRVAARTAAVAREEGTDAAFVLQAFNWDSEPTLIPPGITGRWPTTGQMRRMRNLAWLAGDFNVMLWFDYIFIKPLGTEDETHLDALAKAMRAPYPTKVGGLRCDAGALRWRQSRPGPTSLSVRTAGHGTHKVTARGAKVSVGSLDLPRGKTSIRVKAGSKQLRSASNRVVLRVGRGGRPRGC